MHDPTEFLVPLTSDKGLCGAINSNIVRQMKEYAKVKNRSKLRILPIGEKGSSAMARPFPDMVRSSISEVTFPFNYPTCMVLAEQISKQADGYDRVVIYYNEYKSAISQIIRRMELLPRKRFLETMKFARLYN